jgi:hypothetical protein
VPQTFTLTAKHREEFDNIGVLRLPNFYAPEIVAPMADALWEDARQRFGIQRKRPETWTRERVHQHQKLEKAGVFDALGTSKMRALGDALLGAGAWPPPRHWGAPLVTFPSGAWDVPHSVWHLDLPGADYTARLPMIRVFVFLAQVRPRGGGTPYIAGSHKVVMDRARHAGQRERLRSGEMRKALQREEPWLASLLTPGGEDRARRFMVEGGTMRGFPVRVAEVTGEAGDVIVMHPAMFHSVAKNALDQPRMMQVITLHTPDAW